MMSNTFKFTFEWFEGDFLFAEIDGECEVHWRYKDLPLLDVKLEAICSKDGPWSPSKGLTIPEFVQSWADHRKSLLQTPPAPMLDAVIDWLWKTCRESIDDAERFDRANREQRAYA